MKSLFALAILFFSVGTSAKTYRLRQLDDMQAKIDALTSRVEKLESQVSSLKSAPTTDPSSGLKVIDKKNSAMGTQTTQQRTVSSEQQAEIMNQLKAYQKKREEQQKLLDELMEE